MPLPWPGGRPPVIRRFANGRTGARAGERAAFSQGLPRRKLPAMAESRRVWTGARGWAGDFAFSAIAGLCLGMIGPFGTYLNAPLPFRAFYWIGLFAIGTLFYGPAIRGAATLAGRWRIAGVVWLVLFIAAASAPMSLVSATVATWTWPQLKAMRPIEWYGQSFATSLPLVLVYGALTRRLLPLGPRPAAKDGPLRVLPEGLARRLVCLQ